MEADQALWDDQVDRHDLLPELQDIHRDADKFILQWNEEEVEIAVSTKATTMEATDMTSHHDNGATMAANEDGVCETPTVPGTCPSGSGFSRAGTGPHLTGRPLRLLFPGSHQNTFFCTHTGFHQMPLTTVLTGYNTFSSLFYSIVTFKIKEITVIKHGIP